MNKSIKRVKVPIYNLSECSKNFEEVELGLNEELALKEADRCLNCKNPLCIKGCPIEVNIPAFISEIKQHNYESAYKIIYKSNVLPGTCARVCEQESQCEKFCVRGKKSDSVAIGALQRFVTDIHISINKNKQKNSELSDNYKVAIVGSGPAGLGCAGELLKNKVKVVMYESKSLAGGVLTYGIPEFRLPKKIVNEEIKQLIDDGLVVKSNCKVMDKITIEDLLKNENYAAVFIGTGAYMSKKLNINGENLKNVYTARDFLGEVNSNIINNLKQHTMYKKNVAVIGGGNVAVDSARTAKRLGANVFIVYRRSVDEMPASKKQIDFAKQEGVKFYNLLNPVEIKKDNEGNAVSMLCQKMKLGDVDSSGRRSSVAIEGQYRSFDVDYIISAIGAKPEALIKSSTNGLRTDSNGRIIIDESTGQTSIPNVFAGGDVTTGPATVVLALSSGVRAARSICEYLKRNN